MSNVELLAGIILFLMAVLVILWVGAWLLHLLEGLLDILEDLFDILLALIAFPFRRYLHRKKCKEQVCVAGCLYYGRPRPKEKPDDWEQRQIAQRWAIQEEQVTAMERQGQVTSLQANDMRTYCREQQQEEIKKAKSVHWA